MHGISYTTYKKRQSREVNIGHIALGGNNPVRLQSMTNTITANIEATLVQIKRIADAGADYVRITVPTIKDAELLSVFKSELQKAGYDTPLIADVHFNARIAEVAARNCDKVRINPGNYIDKKTFKKFEYTDAEYQDELAKIRAKFVPLINICKTHNTAMRIGTNHGSLSDRIMSRYGDTPEGMAESVLEFLRICVAEDYLDVVISMKASNPLVMMQAVRLLSEKMADEDMDFPFHLGVTEAGNDTEGRVKSAIGIGTLLLDGIGDTIRVSLTEAPEKELPAAQALVDYAGSEAVRNYRAKFTFEADTSRFLNFRKRETRAVMNIGGGQVPVVVLKSNTIPEQSDADYILTENNQIISLKNNLQLFDVEQVADIEVNSNPIFIEINEADIDADFISKITQFPDAVLILNCASADSPVHFARSFFFLSDNHQIKNPVILKNSYQKLNEAEIIKASVEFGAIFIAGYADGILLISEDEDMALQEELAFTILQACRARITRTEYISCPSCGRTLFDLETATAKIKKATAHLTGVKIGIMGCIVNGPGEMADADYGYVGAGKNKIDLYKGQKIIKRNIPETEAVEELLKFIEEDRRLN